MQLCTIIIHSVSFMVHTGSDMSSIICPSKTCWISDIKLYYYIRCCYIKGYLLFIHTYIYIYKADSVVNCYTISPDIYIAPINRTIHTYTYTAADSALCLYIYIIPYSSPVPPIPMPWTSQSVRVRWQCLKLQYLRDIRH